MVKSDETITIKIDVDDGNATKKIKDLDESLKRLQVSGDQAGNSMKNFGNQTSDAKGSVEDATETFKNSTIALHLNKAAALALEAVKNSMDEAFSRLDAMENFERTLLRIYDGNQEMADQVLSATDDMVTGTAYALDSVADHMKGFIALGNRTWEQATDDVTAWGDAVAFYGDGSSDQFDKVLRNLVSMSSKGSVKMEDLTDAVSAGIPVFDIYAAATGKSVEEVQRSFTTGQVSAEEFLDVMTTSFNDGIGEFVAIEGAAKEVGGSWTNTFSNFSTAVARGTASIISDLDDAFGETRLGSIRSNISRTGHVFEFVLKSVGTVAASTVIVLSRVVSALQPLSPLIIGIATALGTYYMVNKYMESIVGLSRSTIEFCVNIVKKLSLLKLENIQMVAGLIAIKAKIVAQNTLNAVSMITNLVLTIGNVAWGVHSKQITLATAKTTLLTAAKNALNAVMRANPAFLVAAGIGVLTTATIGLVKWFNRSSEETKQLNAEQDELRESVEGLSDSTRDSSDAFSENKKDIEVNRRANMELANEIQALTEVEGDSLANKALLDSKIQELNHSVEGLNLSYDEESGLLSESVEFIEARIKAQAEQEKMNVAQERLTEILREQMETEMKLEEVNAKREIWNEKLKDGTVNIDDHAEAMDDLDEQSAILIDTQEDLGISYEAAARIQQESAEAAALAAEDGTMRQKLAFEDLTEAQQGVVEGVQGMFENVSSTLSNLTKEYKENAELTWDIIQENQQQIIEATDEHTKLYADLVSSGVSEAYLQAIGADKVESLPLLREMNELGVEVVQGYEGEWQEAHERNADTIIDAFEFDEEYAAVIRSYITEGLGGSLKQAIDEANFDEIGAQVPENTADGMTNNQEVINEAADFMATATEEYLDQRFAGDEVLEIGKALPDKVAGGIEEGQPSVFNATDKMVTSADETVQELEPKFNSAGGDAVLGLANGMSENEEIAVMTASRVGSSIFRALKEKLNINSPSRLMRDEIGKPIVEGIAVGIESNANLIDSSLDHLNRDMIHSAQTGSVDVVKSYDELGRDLELSLNRWSLFSRTALTAVNQVFQSQTKLSNRTIFQAVEEMTRTMNSLTPNFKNAGQSAMTGLNQGLLSGRAQVMNTARSIANQVASTMQNALKINSPSRVMRDEVGKWIPYGIAEGIDSHADIALNSTDDLGKQMIKLPTITAESILEGRVGHLGSPQPYHASSIANNSVTNHYSYEGLMEGATIIWKGKEDIRQTMQEIAWITQREEARM